MTAAYLAKLNTEQRRAVEHGCDALDEAPPLLISAGSGKPTRWPTASRTSSSRVPTRVAMPSPTAAPSATAINVSIYSAVSLTNNCLLTALVSDLELSPIIPMQIPTPVRLFLMRVGPYPSLFLLAVPLAIVEPLKLVAVFVFGEGHFIAAILI